MTAAKRHSIEVLSAGCPTCREGLRVVQEIAGKDHDVKVLDMQTETGQRRAKELGINRVPAVIVSGTLAECCELRPVDPTVIRSLIRV